MSAISISMPRFQIRVNHVLLIAGLYFALIINLPFLKRFIQAVIGLDEYSVAFIASIPVLLWLLNMLILAL